MAVWLALQEPVAVVQAAAVEEFRAVRVEISGFDEAALLGALRLRLPRPAVALHGGPAPTELPYVYLQVARAPDGSGQLRAITSDGRAYERRFVIEVGQEVRVAASTAANLLFSIEQGAVAPDRVDVAIPLSEPAGGVEAPVKDVEPAVEEVVKLEPEITSTRSAVVPAPKVVPGWELAVGLNGVGVLGVGAPNYAGVLAGGGGGVFFEMRGRRGGALALDVRGLGRGGAAFAVGRVRVGVAGGVVWRRGWFELPAFVGASIEPWWAGQSGSAVIYSGDSIVSRSPLIGGFLRVTPAVRLVVDRRRLAAVRVGPRVELAGSFAVDGGAKVVGLADSAGQAQARLGGLELAFGLEVALEFSLRR